MELLHTVVLILHVLGATVIIGIAFVTYFMEIRRLLNLPEVTKFIEELWKIAGAALGIQLLTGLYLASSEWEEIGKSPYFWIKMLLFFVLGGTIGFINKKRFEELKKPNNSVKEDSPWSLIGLLTFIIIAVLGVLIVESAAS